jgi:hypothetical protein
MQGPCDLVRWLQHYWPNRCGPRVSVSRLRWSTGVGALNPLTQEMHLPSMIRDRAWEPTNYRMGLGMAWTRSRWSIQYMLASVLSIVKTEMSPESGGTTCGYIGSYILSAPEEFYTVASNKNCSLSFFFFSFLRTTQNNQHSPQKAFLTRVFTPWNTEIVYENEDRKIFFLSRVDLGCSTWRENSISGFFWWQGLQWLILHTLFLFLSVLTSAIRPVWFHSLFHR